MDEQKMERMLAAAAERASRRSLVERQVKPEHPVRRSSGRQYDISAADIEARLAKAAGKRKGSTKAG